MTPQTTIDVVEEDSSISVFEESATVGDVAAALNALGVAPRDLSSIFQQLKESGALHAELRIPSVAEKWNSDREEQRQAHSARPRHRRQSPIPQTH